ncbi:hypothetical protein [Nostoc phage A1]|nr:hypothetical protein [Nostoc phage A1]
MDFCDKCRKFTGVRKDAYNLICRSCDSGGESLLEIKIEPNKVLEKIVKNTESVKAELLTTKKGGNRKLVKKDVLSYVNSLNEPISLKELASAFEVSPQAVRKFFRRDCTAWEFSAQYDPKKREHAIGKYDPDDNLLLIITGLWIIFPSRINIQGLHLLTKLDKKKIQKICQESEKIGKEKENGSWRYWLINAHNLYLK